MESQCYTDSLILQLKKKTEQKWMICIAEATSSPWRVFGQNYLRLVLQWENIEHAKGEVSLHTVLCHLFSLSCYYESHFRAVL